MSEATAAGAVARLEAAADELAAAQAAVDEIGVDQVETVAETYDRFDTLLSRFRTSASGSGRETFEAYVDFQDELDRFGASLDDDLRHRDAFEAAIDVLDRRRLDERDFDRAREQLAPVRDVVERQTAKRVAEQQYQAARRAVADRSETVAAEIEDLEAILSFEDVDFEAPVERLRSPIDAYDSSVHDAFQTFRREASARDVLDFVAATRAYPLIAFSAPPSALRTYVDEAAAGEESIPTLLEWSEFTQSKLSHYVDDPAALRASVGGNRTYLDRLDAVPLEIGWPPPTAGTLRYRGRELVAVVERFAPPETVARLHDVRALARRDDYPALRRTAVAIDRLNAKDRQRLKDGSIHDELETLQAEQAELLTALETY